MKISFVFKTLLTQKQVTENDLGIYMKFHLFHSKLSYNCQLCHSTNLLK